MRYLVTGGAGFIGYHLCKYLLNKDHEVIIIDNLSDYYDIQLKKDRLKELPKSEIFIGDISNYNFYKYLLKNHN